MSDKLQPPEGYNSWMQYVIDTMETRSLHLKSIGGSHWGRIVQRHEMSEAVKAELQDLLAAPAKKDKDIERLSSDLSVNATVLARQCDMAREAERELLTAQRQIAALQDEINNPKKTYCAWCGFTVEIDDDAGSGIAEHVDTCKKHPLNRKIAALTARIKELEGAVKITAAIKDTDDLSGIYRAVKAAHAALKEAGV